MRIAILSDIHGNSIALDAVLADMPSQGEVDAIWVLGDLVAIGHDPVGVLERLAKLPNAIFIRGNTDRYVTTGDRPYPTLEDARADPRLVARFGRVGQGFAWTQGTVTAAGRFEWLSGLPLEHRLTLPDGARLLGVHASPGRDDGSGFHPGLNDGHMRSLVSGCGADLVCVGHTHIVLDVRVGGVRVINPGSVSNPFPPDLRAKYAVLEADTKSYRIEQRYVDYDHAAVIDHVRRLRHPTADFIERHMLGQIIPPWDRSS